MDGLLYLGAVVGVLIFLFANEFILSKLWLKGFTHKSERRRAFVATLFIDPLIASIVCPLASDLYFSWEWLKTCNFIFLIPIFASLLIVYISSLISSFNIMLSLNPTHHFQYSNSNIISFIFSALINAGLTLIILPTVVLGNEDFNPSEECFPFMIYHKIFFTCVVSFSFQIGFTLFYSHLSDSVRRRLIPVLHSPTHEFSPDGKTDITSTSLLLLSQEGGLNLRKNLLTYATISFICLFLTHILRSAFVLCSCLPFIQLRMGLNWTNVLILTKLPTIGLCYCALSKIM